MLNRGHKQKPLRSKDLKQQIITGNRDILKVYLDGISSSGNMICVRKHEGDIPCGVQNVDCRITLREILNK